MTTTVATTVAPLLHHCCTTVAPSQALLHAHSCGMHSTGACPRLIHQDTSIHQAYCPRLVHAHDSTMLLLTEANVCKKRDTMCKKRDSPRNEAPPPVNALLPLGLTDGAPDGQGGARRQLLHLPSIEASVSAQTRLLPTHLCMSP